MVCTGMAQMGMVWQAGQGAERIGRERSGWDRQAWRGMAWKRQDWIGRHGSARHSVVGQGRRGLATLGGERWGVV
jgi:hypothetical protein